MNLSNSDRKQQRVRVSSQVLAALVVMISWSAAAFAKDVVSLKSVHRSVNVSGRLNADLETQSDSFASEVMEPFDNAVAVHLHDRCPTGDSRADATAEQHSIVVGDSLTCDLLLGASADVAPLFTCSPSSGASSDFDVVFALERETQYELKGPLLITGLGYWSGAATVRVTLQQLDPALSILDEELSGNSSFRADSLRLDHSGTLTPGDYRLRVYTQTDALFSYGASVSCHAALVFDAPIVQVDASTWSAIKRLYR